MTTSESSGATAVIAHRVRDSQHAAYETWLQRILPVVAKAPGYLDAQVIRPVLGLTDGYTVILRFDCEDDLRGWLTSPERKHLIGTVLPVLMEGDSYTLHSGIDYLFTPQDSGQRSPKRWKQFLVTWSAILPLNVGLPLLLLPLLRTFGLHNRYLILAIASAVAVYLMVYVIMPRYTRLVRGWLYR